VFHLSFFYVATVVSGYFKYRSRVAYEIRVRSGCRCGRPLGQRGQYLRAALGARPSLADERPNTGARMERPSRESKIIIV
jgi:hypothetical protein